MAFLPGLGQAAGAGYALVLGAWKHAQDGHACRSRWCSSVAGAGVGIGRWPDCVLWRHARPAARLLRPHRVPNPFGYLPNDLGQAERGFPFPRHPGGARSWRSLLVWLPGMLSFSV